MQMKSEGLERKRNIVSVGVNLAPQSGGTFRTVLKFYNALRSKGWSVQILNFSKYPAGDLPEGSETFPTSRIPIWRRYGWSRHVYSETAISSIRNANVIIVHGIYVHPLLQAMRIAANHKIPYILVPHGSLDPFSLSHNRWQKRAWLSLYRDTLFERSAAVLYGSEVEKNRSAVSGLERRPECIPWPVDVNSPSGSAAARQRVKLRHNLASDQRVALFCARLARVKRLAETIRAFLQVAPRDWVLLCVGPATCEVDIDEIRTLCVSSEGRCTYVGPVFGRELEDYYAAADLFVLLSYSENFSHSVGQALALGIPVAVSPGVGLAAYVHRYGGGFVADGDSFADMCRVLSAAVNCSAGQLREQGEIGRKWAERDLSPVAFAEKLDLLCGSVCDEVREAFDRRLGKALMT